jgi:hypothetical protein
MIFTAQEYKWFVPEINGNKELPDSQQVRIKIKIPTTAEADKLSSWEYIPGDGRTSMKFKTEYRRILEDHIVLIENLQIKQDGKIIDIASGKELAKIPGDQGLHKLVDAICTEVLKPEIDETSEKN